MFTLIFNFVIDIKLGVPAGVKNTQLIINFTVFAVTNETGTIFCFEIVQTLLKDALKGQVEWKLLEKIENNITIKK